MSQRVYIVPMEGTTIRGLKYFPGRYDLDPTDNVAGFFDPADPNRADWDWQHYGLHSWAIAAVDGPDTVQAALAAKADVEAIPANLDSNVGAANRDTVRAYLEDAGLPGQWVQNGTLWREVVRTVYGVIVFCKRVDAIRANGTSIGSQMVGNMSLQWGSVPQGIRDAVAQTAVELDVDLSAVTLTTVVRQVLRILGQHWTATPVTFYFNNLRTTWAV